MRERASDGLRPLALRVPVALAISGVLLTTIYAFGQQASAQREQQLIFEQESSAGLNALDDVIQTELDTFRDGIQFVQSTFPGDVESYAKFFAAERFSRAEYANADPGVTVIEAVERSEHDALVAREHAAGNPDFNILSFSSETDGLSYVVTRTQNPVVTPLFSLEGLDITEVAAGSNIVFPDDGLALYQVEDSAELALLLGASADEEGFESLFLIIEPIPLEEATQGKAWAARFFSPELVLSRSRGDDFAAVQSAVRIDGQLFNGEQRSGDVTYDDAELMRSTVVETNGLSWEYLAWADGDLGVSTGLFDQRLVWIIGLLATYVVVMAALGRELQRRNLARTNLELEHARVLASTDGLTGLLNREGFLSAFDGYETNPSGTLFFIDLDGFKSINDTIGHAGGDTALREVAKQIRRNFRGDDIVSRFGGDEFVAYAPLLTEPDVVSSIAQRIVTSVNDAVLDGDARLSCSVGIAVRRNFAPDVHGLIAEADRAMYRAKQDGGGQVVAAWV